jgi:hypothetical protein
MKNHTIVKTMAAGAGITTAVAGAYYLLGTKSGNKNRRKVQAWMTRAKGEILEQIENLTDITKETYQEVVNKVLKKYQALKKIDKQEFTGFVRELRGHWKNIQKAIS